MKMKKISIIAAVAACSLTANAQDYTKGVFVLNEDWYGHNNSTMNFWNVDGKFTDYYIVQTANSYEKSLGCTAQFGQLYGNHIFIMSKQDKDPGESGKMESGRFVMLNKKTMRIQHTLPVLEANSKGKSIADGRGCLAVNEHKVYLGSSNGIYVFNIENQSIEKKIIGSENPLITGDEDNADGTGPLYNNQIGTMLRGQDYVFAIKQDKGILVIDPSTDEIVMTIEGCFSTMVQSKDGNIWAGMNIGEHKKYPYGNNGDSWIGTSLMCIDQYTLESKTVALPLGGVSQSWYAWTAGTLTASSTDNYLYFVYEDPSGGQSTWFTNCHVYRYDIDKNECRNIYDSSNDGLYIYGGAIQCDPVSGNLYIAMYVGENIATQNWVYMIIDKNGKEVATYQPIGNYWYPAMFIFPDNEAPVASEIAPVTFTENNPITIPLADKVSDKDTPAKSIIKSIEKVSDETVVSAAIVKGDLVLTPKNYGDAMVTLKYDSNGKTVSCNIKVSNLSSVEDIESDNRFVVENIAGGIRISGLKTASRIDIYNMQGALYKSVEANDGDIIPDLAPGIYIVKSLYYSSKIIVK